MVLPSASRGLQCPEGKQGRGDQELEAYWRKTRPSAHLSHTDPTSLGNQQTGRRLNLDSVQYKSYNGASILQCTASNELLMFSFMFKMLWCLNCICNREHGRPTWALRTVSAWRRIVIKMSLSCELKEEKDIHILYLSARRSEVLIFNDYRSVRSGPPSSHSLVKILKRHTKFHRFVL